MSAGGHLPTSEMYTCEGSSVPNTQMKESCRGIIFYSAGRIMENVTKWSNFGLDSWEQQEKKANTLVSLINTGGFQANGFQNGRQLADVTDACKEAAKTFSCAIHFPYCPFVGSGISHIPVCQRTCLEVKDHCGLTSLDCSLEAGWRAGGDHCFQMPDSGSFLLSTEQGPYYNLPSWYVAIALVWSLLLFLWCYFNYRDHKCCERCHPRATEQAAERAAAASAAAALAGVPRPPVPPSIATRLHRFMISVPLIKLLIVWFAAGFWIGCEANGLCSFWTGVLWVNMQLIYETSYILIFVLISKGWCITTEHITREQWRSVLMSVCTFYMAESMLLVFKEYMQWTYWMFTAVLYLSFIFSIFRTTEEHVVVLQTQLDHADGERLNVLGQLLLKKLMLLRLFQYLLIGYTISELSIHFIFDAGMQELNTTIVLHEWMEIITAFCLGYICCPDVTSRLYYQGVGPRMNADMQIIPFFKATLIYGGGGGGGGGGSIHRPTKENEQRLSTSSSTSSLTMIDDVDINMVGQNELIATIDEDEEEKVHGGGGGSSGSRRSSFSKEENRGEQGGKEELQKSSHVRRLSKLSKLRRLSKSSVASTSSLRSSLVSNGSGGDGENEAHGIEGEMKQDDRPRTETAGSRSRSDSTASAGSRRGSEVHGGSTSSVVEIKPVRRPRWLFAKRDLESKQGNTSNGMTTLVIVQNPSRVDIQMAARCMHTRGTYRIDGVIARRVRQNSTSSRHLEAGGTDAESDASSDETSSDDDVEIMRGRANSSDGNESRRSSTSSRRGSNNRAIEMTTFSSAGSAGRRVSGADNNRRAPPPPPPPTW